MTKGWPFNKRIAEPAREPELPEGPLLPDVAGREDTQRVVIAIEELRAKRARVAAALQETAEAVEEEAKETSHTLRSFPAFLVPWVARGEPAK